MESLKQIDGSIQPDSAEENLSNKKDQRRKMDSNEVEVLVFFYDWGKTKADYRQKETNHVVLPREVTLNSLKKLFM